MQSDERDQLGGLAELELMLGGARLQRAVGGWARARGLGGDACAVGAALSPPVAGGLAGFLGEHARVELRVRTAAGDTTARLFVKVLPRRNPDKARFIDEGNFFRREALVYSLLEAAGGAGAGAEGPQAWRPRAYVCDQRALVMDDLAAAGCAPRPAHPPLDLPHVLAAGAALARWHAAACRLEEARGPAHCLLREHGALLAEPSLRAGAWLSTAARLTAALLREFGGPRGPAPGLADALRRRYELACDTLRHDPRTLNVLVHRDAWANNILFSYDADGAPRGALLIDFQCVRYAPPAFDVMLLLYLTTDAEFRRRHEGAVLARYWREWELAAAGHGGGAGARAARLGYDGAEFARLCGEGRMLALAAACCICPFVLMEAGAARCFDAADSFDSLMFSCRAGPVLAHAHARPPYRARLMELAEEFVERYITDDDLKTTT